MVNRRWRIIAAAVLLGVVGAGLLAVMSTADVVAKGYDLRPYESGRVFKMQIADSITFYADAESRVRPDLATGSALIVLATVSLMAAALLRASRSERRLSLFYTLAGLGLAYLAIDELVAVHETVGHNLPFLADVPGIQHPDDLIFALYTIPALAFAYYFRDVLSDSRIALRLFVFGGIGFVGAGIADITPTGRLDEVLEFLVAGCVGAGFLILVSTHLRDPSFGPSVQATPVPRVGRAPAPVPPRPRRARRETVDAP